MIRNVLQVKGGSKSRKRRGSSLGTLPSGSKKFTSNARGFPKGLHHGALGAPIGSRGQGQGGHMKEGIRITLCVGLMALGILAIPGTSSAGLNVNIGLYSPAPAYVLTGPPYVVVIPRTSVYYAPGIDVDLFFYQGYWYRPSRGHWYRAREHHGPWRFISPMRVPRPVFSAPHERDHGASKHREPSRGHGKRQWRGR